MARNSTGHRFHARLVTEINRHTSGPLQRITVKLEPSRYTTARQSPVGDNDVDINVADDGVGMTEEVRMRAFDPFFTTRRNHGGTGLGLHVIFNIVTQSLGGQLTLDSAPGRGTVFRIRIPRQAAAATTE